MPDSVGPSQGPERERPPRRVARVHDRGQPPGPDGVSKRPPPPPPLRQEHPPCEPLEPGHGPRKHRARPRLAPKRSRFRACRAQLDNSEQGRPGGKSSSAGRGTPPAREPRRWSLQAEQRPWSAFVPPGHDRQSSAWTRIATAAVLSERASPPASAGSAPVDSAACRNSHFRLGHPLRPGHPWPPTTTACRRTSMTTSPASSVRRVRTPWAASVDSVSAVG